MNGFLKGLTIFISMLALARQHKIRACMSNIA